MPSRLIFSVDDANANLRAVMSQAGKVWQRVGYTDEALRRWLLAFSKTDLQAADPNKLSLLRAELTAFIELWKTPPSHREVQFGACPPPVGNTLISKADAMAANSWLRMLLANLEHNQPTSFAPKITCSLSRIQSSEGWAIVHEISGPPLDVFMWEAYSAFTASARGHQPCARCGRIFVPHGRSLYCSKSCGAVARTLRWRANKARWRREHPEETRDTAHRQYERRIKKAYGPTRKVARRSRSNSLPQ
jgi:hypothetical protein